MYARGAVRCAACARLCGQNGRCKRPHALLNRGCLRRSDDARGTRARPARRRVVASKAGTGERKAMRVTWATPWAHVLTRRQEGAAPPHGAPPPRPWHAAHVHSSVAPVRRQPGAVRQTSMLGHGRRAAPRAWPPLLWRRRTALLSVPPRLARCTRFRKRGGARVSHFSQRSWLAWHARCAVLARWPVRASDGSVRAPWALRAPRQHPRALRAFSLRACGAPASATQQGRTVLARSYVLG